MTVVGLHKTSRQETFLTKRLLEMVLRRCSSVFKMFLGGVVWRPGPLDPPGLAQGSPLASEQLRNCYTLVSFNIDLPIIDLLKKNPGYMS